MGLSDFPHPYVAVVLLDPTTHRILAAGDLNMFYEAIGSRLSLPQRDRTVWDRMQALGLEFLGPQAPHGRPAESEPDDVPSDTKNVPTFYRPRDQAGNRGQSIGLRVRVTRVPRAGVSAGDERD